MSTFQDFKNAPVGATATAPNGNIAIKTGRSVFEWSIYDPRGNARDNHPSDEMGRYTLDPAAPTTAQEALDLAWELAHPVKEGQTMPSDTHYLLRHGLGYSLEVSLFALSIDSIDAEIIRTFDPLPDPLPDWLNAPAVLAAMNECSWQKVWLPKSGGNWICTCCGAIKHWSKMADVTPLYPEEDKGGMYITGPGSIQIKDRNGQTVWEI